MQVPQVLPPEARGREGRAAPGALGTRREDLGGPRRVWPQVSGPEVSEVGRTVPRMPKSRNKRKPGKPRPSGTGGRPGRARWFHGGAPGLRPGTVLVPAATLGLGFHYHDPDAPYDPRWVYLTSDEGVARAYASRYLDGFGRRPPGGVYEVRPLDEPRTDPDYRASPTTYRRCRRAEIIRVVVDGIQLSEAEQNQLEQAYTMWPDEVRVWDADGLINPSPEMTENGVPREWTAMLRPWLSLDRIDPHGRLRAVRDAVDSRDWRGVLEVVPALDARCRVEADTAVPGGYRCLVCGAALPELRAAVRHQLGERPVELLTVLHGGSGEPLRELATAARDRAPDRWSWLPTVADRTA